MASHHSRDGRLQVQKQTRNPFHDISLLLGKRLPRKVRLRLYRMAGGNQAGRMRYLSSYNHRPAKGKHALLLKK